MRIRRWGGGVEGNRRAVFAYRYTTYYYTAFKLGGCERRQRSHSVTSNVLSFHFLSIK